MSAIDLSGEMAAAAGRVTQRGLDHMLALGVSGRTIAELGARQAPFGMANCLPDGDGLYEPGDGPAHVVQPIVAGGAIIDLVAWRTMRPDHWRLRVGVGWCLGEDAALGFGGWDDDLPVAMHATPLDWLRAGGIGFAILDWTSPEIRQLNDRAAIEVADVALERMLTAALRRPQRIPRIVVAGRRRDAA